MPSKQFYSVILLLVLFPLLGLAQSGEEGHRSTPNNSIGVNTAHLFFRNANIFYERRLNHGFAFKAEFGHTLSTDESSIGLNRLINGNLPTSYSGARVRFKGAGVNYERAKSRFMIALTPKFIFERKGKANASFSGVRLAYVSESLEDICLSRGSLARDHQYSGHGDFSAQKVKLHWVNGIDYTLIRMGHCQLGLQMTGGIGWAYLLRNDDYQFYAFSSSCHQYGQLEAEDHKIKENAIAPSFYGDVSLYFHF